MDFLSIFIDELKDIYSLYIVCLVVVIGLFTFFIDGKSLDRDKFKKDALIAKVIGIIYIIIGPLIYIATTIL